MFHGEHFHSVDEKGRLIMPAKFREELGEKFYITRGMEKCLFVLTEDEFERLSAKIDSNSLTDKNARALSRIFYSGAVECSFDKQGRTMIPANLRQYASIESKVAVIGVSKRAEIWNLDNWNEYAQREAEDYSIFNQENEMYL